MSQECLNWELKATDLNKIKQMILLLSTISWSDGHVQKHILDFSLQRQNESVIMKIS